MTLLHANLAQPWGLAWQGYAILAVPVVVSLLFMGIMALLANRRRLAEADSAAATTPETGEKAASRLRKGLAMAVCAVSAFLVILTLTPITLYMVLANLNLHFSSTPQLAFFVAGWSYVGAGLWTVYCLVRRPEFCSLRWLLPLVFLLFLLIWLQSLPANQGLLH